jgi:HEAT repeat protein
LTILGVAGLALWVYYVKQQVPLLPGGRSKQPIATVISRFQQGDETQRTEAILGLRYDTADRAEFEQALPSLIEALGDESESVRNAAASLVGDLTFRFARKEKKAALDGHEPTIATLCIRTGEALTRLLDDPSPVLRAAAARGLGQLARCRGFDAPPPRLVACLDDEAEQVREAACEAMVEYGQGPEAIVPVALRRIPTESRAVRMAFTDVFWHVRLEPSVVSLLVEGMSNEDPDVCLSCVAAINHMGRGAESALPAILQFIRQELDRAHAADSDRGQDILGMASGAIGEIMPDTDPPPGTVELLCEVVKSASAMVQDPKLDGPHPTVAAARAVKQRKQFRQAEAVWSLGVLGRSAAPAVPLLLETFESAPAEDSDDLQGGLRALIAEALAEIGRETPDEDRIREALAKALKAAPQAQKLVIARALRSLGPKSERLVPELKQIPLPPDGARSRIRRVRYPRDRHGAPVRE